MAITVVLSDKVIEVLERIAGNLERVVGKRLSYEEVIEILLTKLMVVDTLLDDVWF